MSYKYDDKWEAILCSQVFSWNSKSFKKLKELIIESIKKTDINMAESNNKIVEYEIVDVKLTIKRKKQYK